MAYIIAIDEGTTSTRAILYDLTKNKIVAQKSSRIKQFYPQAGFVEENASEIYAETLASLVEILELCDDASEVKGIGITNQRETVVAWDKRTGKPLYNAIVWQCRRTAEFMNAIAKTHGDFIRKKTGLVCDAYFSASKMKWLLDNVPEIKAKSESGDLCFGTVDSFLAYKLTGGKAFVTDVTNASRTMLCNLGTASWDDDLLDLFGVDKRSLPKIVMSDARVGEFEYNGLKIPICGMAGDQQAALIGQGCLNAGDSKITYGTGLFMLYNTGYKSIISQNGLVTTIGYGIGGSAVIVECLTDNKNRTAGEIRSYFDKMGGSLGTTNCVSFMFDRKGVIVGERDGKLSEEQIFDVAVEAGADDVTVEEEIFEVYTSVGDFNEVKNNLVQNGVNIISAEVEWLPQTMVTLNDEQLVKFRKMLDMFDDFDDVQNVYHNVDLPEEED